jgi:hypothetical protein
MLASQTVYGEDWLSFKGSKGPGKSKHVVLLAGDEEYRSEESLPMLARILVTRHGFDCKVLLPVDPATGVIDPRVPDNIQGMEALDTADVCVMLWRFRELPDSAMKHFVDYLAAGKPIIALRTSTHAFAYKKNRQSPYAKFDWQSQSWPGGFGQQVLGETWINHHGDHGHQSTRGVINEACKQDPLLRGVSDIWGPSDVYGVIHLPKDARVLLYGQVLTGMKPTDPPLPGVKNEPMMPLVWTRDYVNESGKTSKIFTTTMGAAVDLQNEGLRRLIVNAVYWAAGLSDEIPAAANVEYVGDYEPTWFGFDKFKPEVKPADLRKEPRSAQ